MYYIQAKCGNIADKNPNMADDDEKLSTIDGLMMFSINLL